MREVDGIKVEFVTSEVYFEGLHTPSMISTARATGADVIFLLGTGKVGDDISDETVREMFALVKLDVKPPNAQVKGAPRSGVGP